MKARTGFVCAITVALVSGAVAAHAGPAAATGKLAYVAAIPGEKNDIYLANPDGSGAVDITNTPTVNETQPVFSPDGQRLVFRIPGNGLWLINIDGTGETSVFCLYDAQNNAWQSLP